MPPALLALQFVIHLFLVSAATFIAIPPAQAAPFTCSGDIYQVQSGQLRIFDPILSSYVDVGVPQGSYNAVGYNVNDNFAYGSQGNNLIRINDDGAVENVFNIGFNSFAGAMDNDNVLWLRNARDQYTGVNVLTGATTTINLTGSTVNSADIVFVENNGTRYLLAIARNRIGIIDIDNETSIQVNTTGMINNGSYGASWVDNTGRIFTFHNDTGQIFELFDVFGPSPTAQQVAQGDPSGSNDGFNCRNAPFLNLPPIARDDEFTSPLNTDINGKLFVDNGSGIDEDPEGFFVTANTTPVSGPANGSVTILGNGNFVYTPDTDFIGTDSFDYMISDPSGLTATATVTINITGTINFTAFKTQVGGPNLVTAAGDTIDYEIVVENVGDISLSNLNIIDTFPNATNGNVVLESGDTNNNGIVDVGETWVHSISYVVQQSDMDEGGPLVNQVAVSTDETGNTNVTASASTPVSTTSSMDVTKTANPALNVPAGTTVTYTYEVTNNGNVTLNNIRLDDAHSGSGPPPVPGNEVLETDSDPQGDSTDTISDGIWEVLRPGDTVRFTATYVVTQNDVDTRQ